MKSYKFSEFFRGFHKLWIGRHPKNVKAWFVFDSFTSELSEVNTHSGYKQGLKSSMYLQEFIRWVVCWIYMSYWFVITNHQYWRFTTDHSMDKCAPFLLHHIMSLNQFNDTLSAIWYTNKEVPYEYGFLYMWKLDKSWNQNMADNFSHCASMSLMSTWWIGTTSGIQASFMKVESLTHLEMGDIK